MTVKSDVPSCQPGLWRSLAQLGNGPLARAGVKSLGVQVAAILLGLCQAVILARTLGTTNYGMFATAAGVSAILAAIAVGGFDQYAVRELSRLRVDGEPGTALAFIRFGNRSAMAASLLAGGGLMAVAVAFSAAESGWRTTFMLAGAATPLATMLLLRAGQLRGLGAVVISQIPIAIIRPGTMIVLIAALWMAGVSMAAPQAMTAWFLASCAALVFASAVLHPHTAALEVPAPDPALRRKWILDAAPFLGTTVVVIIFGHVNTLMLAALADPEAAGLFQPVAYLAPVLALPVGALAIPLAPRIVELWRTGDVHELRRITWIYTGATFTGTSLIGLVILLFGHHILSLFGPEFVSVRPALVWVVAATVVFAALGPCEVLSSMLNAQHIVLAASMLALALTVALAALLIPAWGVEGGAMAFAAGIIAGRLAILTVTVRRFGFNSSLIGAFRFAYSRTNG